MITLHRWETVAQESEATAPNYLPHSLYTERMTVPGGWLYRVVSSDGKFWTTTFVPDRPLDTAGSER